MHFISFYFFFYIFYIFNFFFNILYLVSNEEFPESFEKEKSYHFENVNEFLFQLSIELFNSVSMQKCFTSTEEGDKGKKTKTIFGRENE